ncbi:hypothetical protein ACSBR1_000759 [Camellia fascicularis]
MSVMQAVGSIMINKCSEGYPGARYYGGNEYENPLSFPTDTKKISAVSIFFETMPYRLDESTGYIDYDQVCDKQKAILLADMARISGLVAAGVIPSPFEFAHIVTTTTHKSLRGSRGAMIFFGKGVKEINKQGHDVMYDYEDKINQAVFLGLQGGPHNHTISGLAVALKQAMTLEYKAYQVQVLSNCSKVAEGIDGSRAEKVLESVYIAANKNNVPVDVSAMVPGGIRMGIPALTSRGFAEEDFVKVAEFFDVAVKLTLKIKVDTKGTKLKEFVSTIKSDAICLRLQSFVMRLRSMPNNFQQLVLRKRL